MDKITIERETLNAAMMALEYLLEASPVMTTKHRDAYSTAARLRAALAAQPAEPVAWYLPSPDGDDSIFRDHRTVVACNGNKWEGFLPLYTAQPAPAAVPLTDDQLRTDLISCRGTVKSELNHYERLTMVHGKTVVAENYEREAQRLSDLLDRIDALIAASGDKP